MRIGIDARMYSPKFTGIGRYVKELTDHLFEIDQKNEYVLFLNPDQYESFTPPNNRVTKVSCPERHYSKEEQTSFLQKLNNQKLDLMHFTHFNAPIFYRGKTMVTIHDLTLSKFPGKKMTKWYHRLAYHLTVRSTVSKAKHVVAVSQNTKKDVKKLLGTKDKKISVIYESVGDEFYPWDPIDTKKVCEKYHIPYKQYFLYTGVWRDHKNVVGMINAFKKVRAEYPDIYLVMTGKEDPSYPEVIQTIRDNNLENAVIRPGLVPEQNLIGLYNGALCYVFPSFYEGFGLPPLEAMKCHVPVISSNASCLPEIIGSGNALFFNPYNTGEISNAMIRIIKEPQTREALINRGKERITHFSWEKMAKETLGVYERI